jgi:hypothetical protein
VNSQDKTTSVSAITYPSLAHSTTLLTADEGDALALLEALMGNARADTVRNGVTLDPVRPEFIAIATRHIAVSVARWLTEGGGHRERSVLRDGQRTSGRVWDSALNKDWAPTFTAASINFWLDAARSLPAGELEREYSGGDIGGRRRKRKAIKDAITVRERSSDGDWIFFSLAHRSLPNFVLNTDDERALLRALRTASPLAGLFALDLEQSKDAIAAERVSWLFAPGTVRIIECVQDRLAVAWERQLRSHWTRSDTVPNLLPVWAASARALRSYVAAANASNRCDLLRPVLRLMSRLAANVLVGGGDALRKRVISLPGWTTIKERDDMLASVRAVADIGTRLTRLRDEFVLERYGDDRYEEAQLYLRFYAEEYAEQRASVDDIIRGLSNSVG